MNWIGDHPPQSELSGISAPPLRMWAGWAQSPNDICWINVGASEVTLTLKGMLMNVLVVLLILIGVWIMVLSRTR